MNAIVDTFQALNRAFAASESRLLGELAALHACERELRQQKEVLEDELARKGAERERADADFASNIAQLQDAVAAREYEFQRLNRDLFDSDAQAAEAQQTIQRLTADNGQLQAALTRAEAAVAEQTVRLTHLTDRLQAAEAAATEQSAWISKLMETSARKDDELARLILESQQTQQATRRLELAVQAAAVQHSALAAAEQTLTAERERWADTAASRLIQMERLSGQLDDVQQHARDADDELRTLRAVIDARQAELTGAQILVKDQALEVVQLKSRLQQLTASELALSELTTQKDQAIAQLTSAIDAADREAAEQRRRHAEQRRRHAEQQALAQRIRSAAEETHARQTSELAQARKALEQRGLALADSERRAAGLTESLVGAHRLRHMLEQQLGELQRSVDDLAKSAEASTQNLGNLEATTAASANSARERLEAAVTLQRNLVAETLRLRHEVNTMRSSRVWRLTKPLRRLTGSEDSPKVPDAAQIDLAAEVLTEAYRSPGLDPITTYINPRSGMQQANDTLGTLLARHDLDFVDAAYRAVLHRRPDPHGLAYYLDSLRSGTPKVQLLVELSNSPEARAIGPQMSGLHAASRRLRWSRLPLVGPLLRLALGAESPSALTLQLRIVEQQLARLAEADAARAERIQCSISEVAEQVVALRQVSGEAMSQPVETRTELPVFFTICSKNFTGYARTLFDSISAHHPGAEFYMFLCDGPDSRFDPTLLPFGVVTLQQLDIPDVEAMAQRYNITEFNTAIKPFAFQYLFKVRKASEVVYLDPDILVTSPLHEVLDGLRDGADCVLTPHIVNPAEVAEVSDDKMLLFGIYNLGFIALRNTDRTIQIVEWWGRRLEHHCVIALEKGLFVDQKWADLFPAFIPNTLVLRHAGYNVAYWNVPQRAITRRNGVWFANNEPLRFAHFSGNKLDDPAVYSRHSWTLNTENIGELKQLLDIYRETVYANGHREYLKLPYAYNWNGAAGVNLHTPEPTAAAPTETAASAEMPAATPVAPAVALEPETLTEVAAETPVIQAVAAAQVEGAVKIPLSPSALPRLFVTDWSTPRPDQDAGSVTTFFLLKILANLGYDVTFVPSDLEPLGEYTEAVRALGVSCLHREQVASIPEFLAREGSSFAAFVLFRAPIAALYLADIRRFAPDAKVVLETVDLHYLRDERAALADGSESAIASAREAKNWELGIIAGCDVSIVLSSFEQELVEEQLPDADIRTMPLLFLDMPGPSGHSFVERKDILFIGSFRHTPNVDAMLWFCKDIWPLIHHRLPDVHFLIVGSSPPPEIFELGNVDGVEVLGHVKDLDPVFAQLRLSVTPLRYGAGIKGKVATSLGYGVPVVGTTLAFEGMELRDGEHVLAADDADAFADAVVKAYSDVNLWDRLSRNGFERASALYSESAGRHRVEALMDSLEIKSSDFGFHVFRSQKQYAEHRRHEAAEYERRERLELELIRRDGDSFMVPGWCAVCNCATDFQVGFMYSYQSTPSGEAIPNWREHLNCMRCGHTNRVRLMLHLIDLHIRPQASDRVYISEQTTPLYHHLKNHFQHLQGSEYLGDAVDFGQERNGLRNEDLTRLTFAEASFDLMISCDVLEHVTDDLAAFAECYRCLAPGGSVIFTAPCSLDQAKNVVRARLLPDGEIEHLITPPEYHGNPVDPENGALCFRYFGWEVLEQLRSVGFKDAYALSAWSRSLGYLGIEQIVFVATKAA